MPEPDQPVVQPSAEERASMAPVTPAAVAIARQREAEGPAPSLPASVALEPGRLSVEPGRVTGPLLDMTHVQNGLLLAGSLAPPRYSVEPLTAPPPAAASVPQPHPSAAPEPSTRAPGFRWWIVGVLVLGSLGVAGLGVLALGLTGWLWLRGPQRGDLRIESRTPGVTLYLGPTELGPAPQEIDADELVGQPVIAVAPDHEPRILRAERIAELTREGDHTETIDLVPSRLPSTILYVRYDGQGTAYSNEGFGVLGSVPGALRIQNGSGADLTVIDDVTGRHVQVRWEPCELGSLCVLDAR
jgi:hypothetical protein